MHRVAITGVGIVSCLGTGVDQVGLSLRAGKSGIINDEKRRELGFRSPLTGAVSGFDAQHLLNKKQRKTMPDFAQQAYAAVMEAVAGSGLGLEDLQNDETGLIFGCDSTCLAAIEQTDMVLRTHDTQSLGSGLIFRSMTSTVTMNLNTLLKTRGASWTISSACSSGGHAVGQAAGLIQLGRQERMVCGGAQEINWESMCSFDALGAFSTRIDEPALASRPFDASRDGLVPSGGAAAVVLERYDLAKKRGAPILGELVSYAFSSDGAHLSVPSPTGLRTAMRKALEQVRWQPSDIDYICAHATSTPAGDSVEAESIASIFGEKSVLVSSTKSMTGHELWMSGASQVVYSIIMAQQGFIAPNINFNTPDEASAKLNVVLDTLDRPPKNVMCNAAGFGGTNSCLIVDLSR